MTWVPTEIETTEILKATQAAPERSYGMAVEMELTRSVTDDELRLAIRSLAVLYPRVGSVFRVDRDAFVTRTLSPDEVVEGAVVDLGDALASTDVRARLLDAAWERVHAGRCMVSAARLISRNDATLSSIWLFVHHAIADGRGLHTLIKAVLNLLHGEVPAQPVAAAPVQRTVDADWWNRTVAELTPPDVASARGAHDDEHVLLSEMPAQRVQTIAASVYSTPTALLVAAARRVAAETWQWRLERVTVPLWTGDGTLLSVVPLPVIGYSSAASSFAVAIQDEADRIIDAIEAGPPPPALLGALCTSILPGVNDFVVTVDDTPVISHPLLGRFTSMPPTGAPAVVALSATDRGILVVGRTDVVDADSLRACAAALVAVLEAVERGEDPVTNDRPLRDSPLAQTDQTVSKEVDVDEAAVDRAASLWAEHLAKPVRADDDFFRLGVSSLEVAQLAAFLSRAGGRRVPVRVLYATGTPRRFAGWLQDEEHA